MKKLTEWLTSLFLKNSAYSSLFRGIHQSPLLFPRPQMPQVAGVCIFPFPHFPGVPNTSFPSSCQGQVKKPCNIIMQPNLAPAFSQFLFTRPAHRQLFNRITIRPRDKSSQIKVIYPGTHSEHSSSVFTFFQRQFYFLHTQIEVQNPRTIPEKCQDFGWPQRLRLVEISF